MLFILQSKSNKGKKETKKEVEKDKLKKILHLLCFGFMDGVGNDNKYINSIKVCHNFDSFAFHFFLMY